MNHFDHILTAIARKHLLIPTLETQTSDRPDFHDISVGGVRSALKAAFDAGREATWQPPEPSAAGLLEALLMCRERLETLIDAEEATEADIEAYHVACGHRTGQGILLIGCDRLRPGHPF